SKQLVGYVVLTSEPDGWQGELATHLAAQLPDYMVPAQWVALAAMPLSPNGKLERRALPRPASDALVERFVAPSTAMEQALASLWADLLKREAVGVTDNFFALGGDSIISIQLVSRARAAGIQFTPRDLFQHQTVQALARVAQRGEARQVDQGSVSGITPLLPFQQYFFEQPIPNRQHWNQALLLQPREVLRGEALAVALDALVGHHDALRLMFREGPEGWQGEHQPTARPNLLWQVEVSDSAALEALCEDAQRSLTLSEGPLLRAVLA
uniref:phosphopantetheine-binding protein n=1 Tax=Pseudomonas sp. RIT-PI-S TaxID=3035295 RepID=UPI0021DA85D1